jgi:anaerobic ribonucleoside-triphosphate reductase
MDKIIFKYLTEDTDMECNSCGKKFQVKRMEPGIVCPHCNSKDVDQYIIDFDKQNKKIGYYH